MSATPATVEEVAEERLAFPSGEVMLEGRLTYRADLRQPRGLVLLLPPHPFLGGDMDNNVLLALNRHLALAGHLVCRFNYRGIGGSAPGLDLRAEQEAFWCDSTCPRYEAQIEQDCRAALAWARSIGQGTLPLLPVGYSFGCLPLLRLAAAARPAALVLISPPLARWPFRGADPAPGVPKGIYYSPEDFACPPAAIASMYEAFTAPKQLQELPEADHFFIGQEGRLSRAVAAFLDRAGEA